MDGDDEDSEAEGSSDESEIETHQGKQNQQKKQSVSSQVIATAVVPGKQKGAGTKKHLRYCEHYSFFFFPFNFFRLAVLPPGVLYSQYHLFREGSQRRLGRIDVSLVIDFGMAARSADIRCNAPECILEHPFLLGKMAALCARLVGSLGTDFPVAARSAQKRGRRC